MHKKSIGDKIYLDYAAGAPLRPEVFAALEPWLKNSFANPSALYREAENAYMALEKSRATIARALGVRSHEIIFTASSTEANNLAIFGAASAWQKKNKKNGHIITITIEHPSILEPLRALEESGWEVTKLSVDKEGFVNLEELKLSLSPETAFVTIGWANPDIGAVQPVVDISKIIREHEKKRECRTLLHVDGSQAFGALDAKSICSYVDCLTVSSAKIGGPRGIAALSIRSGVQVEPIVLGGGQENYKRSGTENVASAVGFAHAVELAANERAREAERLVELRDFLINKIIKEVPGTTLTGPGIESSKRSRAAARLPNHASFAFKDILGEELAVRLDEEGFMVGTGSACASATDEVSRAVRALGLGEGYLKGTLRVTLGKDTKANDLDKFAKALFKTVTQMRSFAIKK